MRSGLRSLKAFLALNSSSRVGDIEFRAQADEIGVPMIFKSHHGAGQNYCASEYAEGYGANPNADSLARAASAQQSKRDRHVVQK